MEHDSLGLHLSVLDIDLIATKNNGNVLANTSQISVPLGHIRVCDTRSDIKHDDGSIAIDIVPITKAAKSKNALGRFKSAQEGSYFS